MDWEDLKFFLAVAREGSLAGAGRRLGVKHSTVLRRIAGLEASLGLKLFERHPSGHVPTVAGRDMLAAIARIDDDLAVLERQLAGRDRRMTGTVRLSTVGVLVPWIAEALAGFRRLYPGVRIEAAVSPAEVSLSRHEADISVRVTRRPPKSLVGRRVACLAHGVYAAHGHPAVNVPQPDIYAYDWVAYSDSRTDVPQAHWMATHVPDDRVVLHANHTGMVVAAVQSGVGLGILPCYLGDADTRLKRLATVAGLGQELWVLTHADLRRTPRVQALMAFLAKELGRYRDLIEGRSLDNAAETLPPL